MARGWESKSVESQIDERETRRDAKELPPATPAEQERAGLMLTRKRVLRDLWNATQPRHRDQLMAALKHLDEKIAALSQP